MTHRQKQILYSAKNKIAEVRQWLDDIMYRTDPLDDEEFKKIRDAYDLICKANDKLP